MITLERWLWKCSLISTKKKKKSYDQSSSSFLLRIYSICPPGRLFFPLLFFGERQSLIVCSHQHIYCYIYNLHGRKALAISNQRCNVPLLLPLPGHPMQSSVSTSAYSPDMSYGTTSLEAADGSLCCNLHFKHQPCYVSQYCQTLEMLLTNLSIGTLYSDWYCNNMIHKKLCHWTNVIGIINDGKLAYLFS